MYVVFADGARKAALARPNAALDALGNLHGHAHCSRLCRFQMGGSRLADLHDVHGALHGVLPLSAVARWPQVEALGVQLVDLPEGQNPHAALRLQRQLGAQEHLVRLLETFPHPNRHASIRQRRLGRRVSSTGDCTDYRQNSLFKLKATSQHSLDQ